MLKLFFGREAGPGISMGHLRELQSKNQQMLSTLLKLEAVADSNPSQNPHMPYWMLTLSLGTALTRAALDWGELAMAQLSAMEAGTTQMQRPTEKSPATNKA